MHIRSICRVFPGVIFPGVIALLLSAECTFASPPPGLTTPTVSQGAPAAGRRVRQQNAGYKGTGVYHLLYLPTNWKQGKKFPVIVEYAGNKWRASSGRVEGSCLGYGISGGKDVIWVCMPFVNTQQKRNQETWWGDVEATVAYCEKTVQRICQQYGGDADNVFIAGFSRGAIACNYIGLHNDSIAKLWKGFICHSHYDGVRKWSYAGSDRAAAAVRLKRLGKRPQFISHESSVTATRQYLKNAHSGGNFTFVALPTREHTDTWVLYDSPQRQQLRDWFQGVVKPSRKGPEIR